MSGFGDLSISRSGGFRILEVPFIDGVKITLGNFQVSLIKKLRDNLLWHIHHTVQDVVVKHI